jgi:hypothetical protein
MLKRVFIISLALALTGCATHQQSNQALGAVLGGAVGHHAIGGSAGTAIGAMIGGAIGGNQPRVYHEQQIIHPINPSRYAQCEIYLRRFANCSSLPTTRDERSCQISERSYYNSCMIR